MHDVFEILESLREVSSQIKRTSYGRRKKFIRKVYMFWKRSELNAEKKEHNTTLHFETCFFFDSEHSFVINYFRSYMTLSNVIVPKHATG